MKYAFYYNSIGEVSQKECIAFYIKRFKYNPPDKDKLHEELKRKNPPMLYDAIFHNVWTVAEWSDIVTAVKTVLENDSNK